MAAFEYTTLQDFGDFGATHGRRTWEESESIVSGAWEIRLARLLPSKSRAATVKCELLHKTFNTARGSYEALSYAWGDTTSRVDILVKGFRFPVTPNLQAALIYLRRPDGDRLLWIDQICINEADILERNRQVERMTLIYGYSARTVIWLGEEAHGSYRGMLLLRGLSRVAKEEESREKALAAAVREFSDVAKWKALDLLLERAWWQRTWVVQECAFPKDITIQCGYRDLPWTDLASAVALVGRLREEKLMPQCVGRASVSSVIALHKSRVRVAARGDQKSKQDMPHDEFDTLLGVLVRYRSRQATDARDKVYALMRLAQDLRDAVASTPYTSPISVDYTRPVEVVYQDVASFLLSSSQRIDFLSYCRQKRNLTDLPSWVPDWSDTSKTPYPFIGSCSTGGNPRAVAHIDGRRLLVRGFQFDGVKALGDTCVDADFARISPSGKFRQWKALALGCSQQPVRGSISIQEQQRYSEEDFMRTVVADCVYNERLDETMLPSCREAYRIWDARDPDAENNSAPAAGFHEVLETLDFVTALQRASLGRRFFASTKGAIGLVPKETETDDLLVAFLGASLPFVVRKCGEYDYTLVGGCYIHKYADGERINGLDADGRKFEQFCLV